jgi:hypothetical protein
MIDKYFMQSVRETKQSHERFMTAILASDVFPGLDVNNPLENDDVDEVPARFGTNWFQHEREERKAQDELKIAQDAEEENHGGDAAGSGELRFSQVVMQKDDREVEDLDSLIDQQRRLLFTETKIKVADSHHS